MAPRITGRFHTIGDSCVNDQAIWVGPLVKDVNCGWKLILGPDKTKSIVHQCRKNFTADQWADYSAAEMGISSGVLGYRTALASVLECSCHDHLLNTAGKCQLDEKRYRITRSSQLFDQKECVEYRIFFQDVIGNHSAALPNHHRWRVKNNAQRVNSGWAALYCLDMIRRELERLSQYQFIDDFCPNLLDEFDQIFPNVRDIRNSMAHADERARWDPHKKTGVEKNPAQFMSLGSWPNERQFEYTTRTGETLAIEVSSSAYLRLLEVLFPNQPIAQSS